MDYNIIKFFIFFICIISSTKQDIINIIKISNMGTHEFNLNKTHIIIQFDCTPYFKNDNRNMYISFNNGWNADLYIFYDQSKINNNSDIKYPGYGYDQYMKHNGTKGIYLNPKQNIVYLVFTSFYLELSSFSVQCFNLNGYYDLSYLNQYTFSFPQSELYFTFRYRKQFLKPQLISFAYSKDGFKKPKTILYNSNRDQLKVVEKFYGGFCFRNINIDQFFIKAEVSGIENQIINFLMDDYSNLKLIRPWSSIHSDTWSKYNSYVYFVDTPNIYEDEVKFESNLNISDYIYYYYLNETEYEEIKSEIFYKENITQDFSGKVRYENFQLTIPTNKTFKQLAFRINAESKKSKYYYLNAIYYSSKEINTSTKYSLEFGQRPYYIFNYNQKRYFNNSLNGFISAHLIGADILCSLYEYSKITDINVDLIKGKKGNFEGKNWKYFNYESGDIYFLITNFGKTQSIKTFYIENNNEYYNITSDFNFNSTYSFYMQFNNTRNQHLTFSLTPQYYHYVYFNITPTDLRSSVSVLASNNNIISPVDNKYYFLNSIDSILFKIYLSSDNDFNEFKVNIGKLDELPNNTDKTITKTYCVIIVIIIGAIQVLLFIIYMFHLNCKRKILNIGPIQNQELNDMINE